MQRLDFWMSYSLCIITPMLIRKHWFSSHLWALINPIYTRGTTASLHIGLCVRCALRWKWDLPSVDVVRFILVYILLLLLLLLMSSERRFYWPFANTLVNAIWLMSNNNTRIETDYEKCFSVCGIVETKVLVHYDSWWYLINVARRINNNAHTGTQAHRQRHLDHILFEHNDDTLVICWDSNT